MSASGLRWLGVAVVALGLATAAPVVAQPAAPSPEPAAPDSPAVEREPLFPGMSEDEEEIAVFILGNTMFTFYHEISEALIDEFKLRPRDPAAIDSLATMLMLPDDPDPLRDQLVVAASDGLALAADERTPRDQLPAYWGAKGIDEERAADMICLIVGSDPVGFREFAEESGIPDDRVDACKEAFETSADGWIEQLDPFTRESKGRRARGGSIRVVYDDVAEFRPLRDLLKATGVVEAAAADLVGSFILPRTLGVRFARCGVADAWWKPSERTVTICYELVQAYERLIKDDLQQR